MNCITLVNLSFSDPLLVGITDNGTQITFNLFGASLKPVFDISGGIVGVQLIDWLRTKSLKLCLNDIVTLDIIKTYLKTAHLKATLENRPAYTSMSFLRWRRNIVTQKERDTVWTAQTKYYVSESEGDDSNPGTEAEPFQTLAKAQTILDGLEDGSKTVVYLKCGDTWEEEGTATSVDGNTCLLRLTKTYSGVSSYGTGDKPFVNQFDRKYSSGWTVHSGDVYVRSEINDIASIRLVNDRLVPLYDASDTTDCATNISDTNGSYFYDSAGNNLYINLGGTDPNTVTLEAAVSNDSTIEVADHGCFVENIRFDGHVHRSTRDKQAGIRINLTGSKVGRIENCEAYYGSSHLIHFNCFTGTGGIAVIKNCIAGYSLWNSAGNTIFNSFAQNGEQETYVQDCEVPYGTLPGHEWTSTNSNYDALLGSAFYCHTGGSEATTGFILIDGMDCTHDNPWGPQEGSYNGSPPSAATIEDAKVVVFNESVYNSRLGLRMFRIAPANGVTLCSSFIGGYGTDRNYRALSATNQSGWFVNSLIDVECPAGLANAHGIWNGNSTSSIEFHFSKIIQRANSSTHDFQINYDGSSVWPDSKVFNNIFARIGTYDTSNYINSAANQTPIAKSNGYYQWKEASLGIRSFITTDEAAATSTDSVDVEFQARADTTDENAIVPEYDRLMNRRPLTPSIGDIDLEDATVSTFTPLDIDDLLAWFDPSDVSTLVESSNVVESITDKSPNSYTASQNTEGQKPTLSGNYISFDESNDHFLSTAGGINFDTITNIYHVFAKNGSEVSQEVMLSIAAGNNDVGLGVFDSGTPRTAIYDGSGTGLNVEALDSDSSVYLDDGITLWEVNMLSSTLTSKLNSETMSGTSINSSRTGAINIGGFESTSRNATFKWYGTIITAGSLNLSEEIKAKIWNYYSDKFEYIYRK